MIVLDSTTRSLQIILSGAKNTTDAPWVASYEDVYPNVQPSGITRNAGSQNGTTNGVAAVTILSSPGGGSTAPARLLNNFSMANADAAAITPTIQYVDSTGSVTRKCFGPLTLQVNETLCYEDRMGWQVLDANGNLKTTPGTASSTADSKATSAGTAASTASSAASLANTVATSSGISASVASSAASLAGTKADSAGVSASVASSAASLANTKADSDGLAASQASSAASLADSKGSNAQSRLTSAGK